MVRRCHARLSHNLEWQTRIIFIDAVHPSQVVNMDDDMRSLSSLRDEHIHEHALPQPYVIKDFHLPVKMVLALSVHMMGVFNAHERTTVCFHFDMDLIYY